MWKWQIYASSRQQKNSRCEGLRVFYKSDPTANGSGCQQILAPHDSKDNIDQSTVTNFVMMKEACHKCAFDTQIMQSGCHTCKRALSHVLWHSFTYSHPWDKSFDTLLLFFLSSLLLFHQCVQQGVRLIRASQSLLPWITGTLTRYSFRAQCISLSFQINIIIISHSKIPTRSQTKWRFSPDWSFEKRGKTEICGLLNRKTLPGNRELPWWDSSMTRPDADTAHTRKVPDVMQMRQTRQMQIDEDASIRSWTDELTSTAHLNWTDELTSTAHLNWTDELTSRESTSLLTAMTWTSRSHGTFQRLCGNLWSRKMVRLINHNLDQRVGSWDRRRSRELNIHETWFVKHKEILGAKIHNLGSENSWDTRFSWSNLCYYIQQKTWNDHDIPILCFLLLVHTNPIPRTEFILCVCAWLCAVYMSHDASPYWCLHLCVCVHLKIFPSLSLMSFCLSICILNPDAYVCVGMIRSFFKSRV